MPDELEAISSAVCIVILGLATARLTSLIVHDAILERFRHEVFLLSPPYDDPELGFAYQSMNRVPWRRRRAMGRSAVARNLGGPRRAGFFGRLLSCPHCVGVWAAALLAAAWVFAPAFSTIVIAVLAAAQIHEIAHRAARL